MVNLVKAREKAKKGEQRAASSEPAIDKLERFKAGVGMTPVVVAPASSPAVPPPSRRRHGPVGEPPGAPAAASLAESTDLELLTFAIDGERYAIEVERVIEIAAPRPLTRVPNADPFIRGVMSLRGVVVTVVDVRARLRHQRNGADQQLVVVSDPGGPIGFDVDRVLRPVKVGPETIEPHPVVHPSEEREFIRGVVRQKDALTIVLDLDKLLS